MTTPTVPVPAPTVTPDPSGLLDEQRRDYQYPSEPPLSCDGPALPTAGGTTS